MLHWHFHCLIQHTYGNGFARKSQPYAYVALVGKCLPAKDRYTQDFYSLTSSQNIKSSISYYICYICFWIYCRFIVLCKLKLYWWIPNEYAPWWYWHLSAVKPAAVMTNDNSTISAMVSLALTWCFNTSSALDINALPLDLWLKCGLAWGRTWNLMVGFVMIPGKYISKL